MMSFTSLTWLFGILSVFSVQLSVALPQGLDEIPLFGTETSNDWHSGIGSVVLPGLEYGIRRGSTCSCNGNINEKGSGECKTTHQGRSFCYVNSGQCSDEKESSQSGWFWSNEACETRTTSTLLGSNLLSAGSRTGSSVPQGDCSCSEHTEMDHRGKQIGKCLSIFGGNTWCYVPSNSNCGDKKQSNRNPSLLWSHIACQTNTDSESGKMLNPVVLLTGGHNPKNSGSYRSVEVYSPWGSCNKDLEDLPSSFNDHSVDFFNGEVIICKTRCLVLDQNQRFVTLSTMNQPHYDNIGTVVSDTLIIVGGAPGSGKDSNGNIILRGIPNSVESWSGTKWTTRTHDEIEDLQYFSCMNTISKDTLLLVGGTSDYGATFTNKMMKYYKADKDTEGVWERVADFPGPARRGLGCALVKTPEGDSFLIAGGTTKRNSYQDTSFLYNIQKNTWEEVGKLSTVRLGGKILVVDGRVIMLGGSYAPTTVEEYNVESKTWSPIQQKIKQTRGQFDAVVVPGALVGC